MHINVICELSMFAVILQGILFKFLSACKPKQKTLFDLYISISALCLSSCKEASNLTNYRRIILDVKSMCIIK